MKRFKFPKYAQGEETAAGLRASDCPAGDLAGSRTEGGMAGKQLRCIPCLCEICLLVAFHPEHDQALYCSTINQ